MMEPMLARENRLKAWPHVMSNAGAPGPRIRSALREGTYPLAPGRRVFIPKPDGTPRPLGVPTVLDRVIQPAMAQVLSPLFERGFSDHSYGFREGRSAHQAGRHGEAGWKEGRRQAGRSRRGWPTSRWTRWTRSVNGAGFVWPGRPTTS